MCIYTSFPPVTAFTMYLFGFVFYFNLHLILVNVKTTLIQF